MQHFQHQKVRKYRVAIIAGRHISSSCFGSTRSKLLTFLDRSRSICVTIQWTASNTSTVTTYSVPTGYLYSVVNIIPWLCLYWRLRGIITLSVHSTHWRPVTHAQTWASYSAVYWLCSLSASDSNALQTEFIFIQKLHNLVWSFSKRFFKQLFVTIHGMQALP